MICHCMLETLYVQILEFLYKITSNRVRIELLYRPARLHGLAESIPWSQFLGSLTVKKTVSGVQVS
jgi:hypothetical protein